IDIDGCSFGPRLQIENVNWSDPLVPRKHLAGTEVDRYRVALLTARCLTGQREAHAATAALEALAAQDGTTTQAIARLVVQAVSAPSWDGRPPLAGLHGAPARAIRALDGPVPPKTAPGSDGVIGWKTIIRPPAATAQPDTAAPNAASVGPARQTLPPPR